MKRVKLVDDAAAAAQHLAAMECDYWSPKLLPAISFMACTRYDDGEARKPGEMRIKTKGASWEVQLIDHDGRAHCRMVASALDDCLAMVCLGLETEDMPWELADWLPQPRKKK